MTQDKFGADAARLAFEIGKQLIQRYQFENGRWALYSFGNFQRELGIEEVAWHKSHNHFPECPTEGTIVDPANFTPEEWFGIKG